MEEYKHGQVVRVLDLQSWGPDFKFPVTACWICLL